MSSNEAISWSVELPQEKKTALGQRRPRARLLVGENEALFIPLDVGRRLQQIEKEGREFGSRAELLFTLRELSERCAHNRMERLVNYREYSSYELRQKLSDDGYQSSLVDEVVSRALDVGVIDDTRFAESFIRSKVNSGWGSGRILRELERRGIATDVLDGIDELLPSYEDEADRAYELASRRRLTGSNDYQKIVRHLVSRGFSVNLASAAARRVLDEAENGC